MRSMQPRRHFLRMAAALGVLPVTRQFAEAAAEQPSLPGVTDTEIKIGQTMPYSGPASAWGAIGLAELAYFKMINDRGGINGRKIRLISLDDGFSPPKTVEQTRKLIEQEGVVFIFGSLGPGNLAIRKYLNDRAVPHIFILAPLEKYNDPQHFPWTIGLQPTYYIEGRTHARYILVHKPRARIAVLHANDDSSEAVKGLRDGLGDKAAELIVKVLTYEDTDPTIDSKILVFQASGADALYNVASPKFAAQAIRKANEIGWKPLQLLSFISHSVEQVLEPAGLKNCVGIVSAYFAKDPADPRWKDDPNTRNFLDWLQKYYPSGKPDDTFLAFGYDYAQVLVYLLEQCGANLSRANIMRKATNFQNVTFPWLLPGIALNTSPTNYQPIATTREMRFNGKTWELLEEQHR
jgi:branched-chain amino acid transport system substrate-binding protein